MSSAVFTPNDPHWDTDPYVGSQDQWGPEHINVDDAWDLSDVNEAGRSYTNPGKKEILVAILDTGLNHPHDEFEDVLWINPATGKPGYDFADDDDHIYTEYRKFGYHGAMIAGIIAANTHNNQGIAGIANVRLMILKLYDNFEQIAPPNKWKQAIDFTRNNGADIIVWCSGYPQWQATYQQIWDAVTAAWNNNVLIFKASGNWRGNDGWDDEDDDGHWDLDECEKTRPLNAHENIISVGSTTIDDVRWVRSIFSEDLDIMAPGGAKPVPGLTEGEIYSTTTGPFYGSGKGTSYAAPHAAGVAALMLSYRPSLTNSEARMIIESTCDDIIDPGLHEEEGEDPDKGKDKYTGHGLVNARKALELANEIKLGWCPPQQQSSALVDPVERDNAAMVVDQNGNTHIAFLDDRSTALQIYYRRVDPTGAVSVPDMRVSNGVDECHYPDLFVDADLNVHIVWNEYDYDLNEESIRYVKYNSDMTATLINRMEVISDTGCGNFNTIKVVAEIEPAVGGRDAFIFYDIYDGGTVSFDIKYSIVDENGLIILDEDYITETDDINDGRGPGGFDVDMSYRDNEERIHIVWQEDDESHDIKYMKMDKTGPANPPEIVTVADEDREEKHPSMDVQFDNGFAHIVYEEYDGSDPSWPRRYQRIRYSVLDPAGGFLLEKDQVGWRSDHSTSNGRNGKFYPDIAYNYNDVVTIVWREWVDDYLGGNNGYFSVYYSQYIVDYERFRDDTYPYNITLITPDKEQFLRSDISTYKNTEERVLVASTDQRTSSSDYDLDSHIRVLYQEEISLWSFKLTLITTRETWGIVNNIGFMDVRRYDPDIDLDENDDWHLVYYERDNFNNPNNIAEVYYRTNLLPFDILVSDDDKASSLCPRVVTNIEFREGSGNIPIVYVFFIDYSQNNHGELFYAALNPTKPPPNYYDFPTPNGPERVPFTQLNPGVGHSQHEIALDQENSIIHVVFREWDAPTSTSSIHHGSVQVGPNPGTEVHRDNEITTTPNGEYSNPSIDLGPENRPYVVYVDENAATKRISYDILEEEQRTGYIVMDEMFPYLVDNSGAPADSDFPDIKVDRGISRRSSDEDGNRENRFVHITWSEQMGDGKYSVYYSKFHPLDCGLTNPRDPEINMRSVLHSSFKRSQGLLDPELAITSDNRLAVIFSANTMGYGDEQNNRYHLFYVLLDNNGVAQTTPTMVSDIDSNNVWVFFSASDLDSDDQLYCAWEIFNAGPPGGNGQSIWWRTFTWDG